MALGRQEPVSLLAISVTRSVSKVPQAQIVFDMW